LHGRSLLFVRNVGHLMTNPAILDAAGNEIPEGIQDALFTSLIAIHNLNGNTQRKNTRTGSVISLNRRCTARKKSPSPPRSSAALKTSWACRATR
jgi:hypothetical protein